MEKFGKEYMREWREKNREHYKELLRKWREEHPNYYREWIKEHPNYHKEWAKKNPEKIKLYQKKKREKYIPKPRKRVSKAEKQKRMREYTKEYYRKNKRILIEFMGNKCVSCGLMLKDVNGCQNVFVVDEIIPQVLGKRKGTNLSKKDLLRAKQLFREGKTQLFCSNCHRIKTWEGFK